MQRQEHADSCLHCHQQLQIQVGTSRRFDWQTSLNLNPLTALLGSNGNGFLCRQMIRMTWGNDKYLKQINATLLFVVGRFPNLKIQWRLEQEGKK